MATVHRQLRPQERPGIYSELSFGPTVVPTGYSFAFPNNTTLVFGMQDLSTWKLTNAEAVIGDSTWTAPSPLDDLYDLEPLGANWWLWKDQGGTSASGTTTDLAETSGVTFNRDRSNGSTTGRYRPSTVYPPALTTADNLAHAYPYLYLSKAATTYGQKVQPPV